MNKIAAIFAKLKEQNRTAFIPYIMAGDPNLDASLALMNGLCAGGADLIEVGIPFSDPTADGVTIQQAGLRALTGGVTLVKVLELCAKFRENNQTTPIILMGYANPIMQYGYEKFAQNCPKYGIDGVIVVDLPPEEEGELQPYLQANNVDFVRLIAPTTKGERLQQLCANASGFVYSINVKGITGAKSAQTSDIKERIAEIRAHTNLPIVAGFGIKTANQVAALKNICDGVVVGSALIEQIFDNPNLNSAQLTDLACNFVTSLKQ